ncbi:DNA repair protein RecO [Candidatus Saccharibacteria bacterium]|nr:DNA repair protein RecO [Candidatus Saccharibacteria bacterium]
MEYYKGPGLVLRRTNYGEADRIIEILTPNPEHSKIRALARGVRKDKSKQKGGIEILAENEFTIRFSTKTADPKSSLAILTSARMIKFYGGILTSVTRLAAAERLLKIASRAAEEIDNPEFYRILKEAFAELEQGDPERAEAWATMQFYAASGQDIDLYQDVIGRPLVLEARYDWLPDQRAFKREDAGAFTPKDIQYLRTLV